MRTIYRKLERAIRDSDVGRLEKVLQEFLPEEKDIKKAIGLAQSQAEATEKILKLLKNRVKSRPLLDI